MLLLLITVASLSLSVAPSNAQRDDYGCNASWVLTPNAGIYGGSEQPNVTTEPGCRAACYRNTTCQGVDFNTGNPTGHQCYMQFTSGPKNYFPGVNHWDFNRTAQCPGVCGKWTRFPNTGVYGGVEQPNAMTEDDCRASCVSNGSCSGVDWNQGNPATHQCYLQFGNGAKNNFTGVTHWDYNSTAGCQSTCGTWTQIPNTGVYGGIEQPSITSEDACKSACMANASCNSIDWNGGNPVGHQCYLQFGYGPLNSWTGITHWVFNRTGPCPVDCINAFVESRDTGVYGGVEQPNINNVTDCKRACIANTSCNGIDWSSNNAQGHQCYLQFTNGPKYNSTGVYHYDFNRSACNGSMNFLTTTVTTPVSNIPPGTGPQYCWSLTSDTHSYGGAAASYATTISACQMACVNTGSCAAIDWDRNAAGCYIFTNTQPATYQSPGVDHYQYLC